MISVIMLTYNREQYVRNMIEDVLGQTYDDFEFIIVNNGSSDSTGEILDFYATRDSRIKLLHLLAPRSIGYARNKGLNVAIGEYATFVDDDDRISINYLDFLYALIVDNNADISMCGCSEFESSVNERIPQCTFDEKMVLTGEEAVKLLLDRKYIRAGIPTKLYKTSILKKHPFVENYKNEDVHTQYRYLLESNRIALHGVDQYYIYRHAGNVSNFTSDATKWDYQIMSGYLDAYRDRTEYIKEKAPSIYIDALYSMWAFMISMVNKIETYKLEDCETIKNQLIAELRVNSELFLNMTNIKPFEIEWMKRYVING